MLIILGKAYTSHQMESKQFKQMAHISHEYTRLKSEDPSIQGFAIVDDKGYPLLEQNIPRCTVLRNMMTICSQLFSKGDKVTVAAEGVSKTLWLSEKEDNYVIGLLKSHS